MAVYLPLALTCAAFVLHMLGERRAAVLTGRPRNRLARRRALTFYAGLGIVVIAIATPIDVYAQKLLWVHMIQHMLLLTFAAPLIVLGVPWMSLWRPLPLGFRRSVARALYKAPRFKLIRAFGGWWATPFGAWLMFALGLWFWHWPAAYDFALRNSWAHALEHLTFITCAVLFWAQVCGLPPARKKLPELARAAYVLVGSATNVVIAAVLAFSTSAIYPYYVHLLDRPGGITALQDQQIAAGIMWSVGDLPFGIAIVWIVYRWLSDRQREDAAASQLVARMET